MCRGSLQQHVVLSHKFPVAQKDIESLFAKLRRSKPRHLGMTLVEVPLLVSSFVVVESKVGGSKLSVLET